MLISPTEPSILRSLGTISSTPESYGVDFLFPSTVGTVGVQRKEYKDLIASVHDGRLAKELAQMKQLHLSVLLIEGSPKWSSDGVLLDTRSQWTVAQHYGVQFSVMLSGIWVNTTASLRETLLWLSVFTKWVEKEKHTGIGGRPKPSNGSNWGLRGSRDWGVHVLQGFEGVGVELAGRIWDRFGLPLEWTVTEGELGTVEGIGKGRARQIIKALEGENHG